MKFELITGGLTGMSQPSTGAGEFNENGTLWAGIRDYGVAQAGIRDYGVARSEFCAEGALRAGIRDYGVAVAIPVFEEAA